MSARPGAGAVNAFYARFGSPAHGRHGGGGAPDRSVLAGPFPTAVAVDQATHTVYVGNGGDSTVSVIDASTCNAHEASGCQQTPSQIAVGGGPVYAAVNEATDTIYVVALGSNTVTVINGATCNASIRTGCGDTPASVTVGDGPDGIAIDEATDTVYVANAGPGDDNTGHTVSVVNGASCNGHVTSGCGQSAPTIGVGLGPTVPAFNSRTRTLYVPNGNPGAEGVVSVIDTRTCNALVTTGCGQVPYSISVGFDTFPVDAAVDESTDTVYVTAFGPGLGSVYVVNGAICNATRVTGCGQSAPTVTVGSGPTFIDVNPLTHSVFVVDQEDSTVSVIDGYACNAVHPAGCRLPVPTLATGFSPGSYLGVDLATDTVYVAVEANVSVLDGAGCTLLHQQGCRHSAPVTAAGGGPSGIAVNAATNTVYVANKSDNDLSVINAAACNGYELRGCGRTWPTVAAGPTPRAVAVNERTNTVYVTNADPDNGLAGTTVSVVDGSTCNAHTTSGCHNAPATIDVGTGPDALAVDEWTDTIYVADFRDGTVSVIDGAHCRAGDVSGCTASPATVAVGTFPAGVAVDHSTGTVYVTNSGANSVSLINARTCNATTTSGCSGSVSTLAVGAGPNGLAVNEATHTLYVENSADSTLSVINTTTCNAQLTSGCGLSAPTLKTGDIAFMAVAVDERTNTVVAGSIAQSAVDVFHGATCDAAVTSGCGQPATVVPTGGWPANVAIDPDNGTVYAADNVDGEVSLFSEPRTPYGAT